MINYKGVSYIQMLSAKNTKLKSKRQSTSSVTGLNKQEVGFKKRGFENGKTSQINKKHYLNDVVCRTKVTEEITEIQTEKRLDGSHTLSEGEEQKTP